MKYFIKITYGITMACRTNAYTIDRGVEAAVFFFAVLAVFLLGCSD